MTPPAEPAEFSLQPILEVLERHQVDYPLLGGNATMAYGATRPTAEFDGVPRTTDENLRRRGSHVGLTKPLCTAPAAVKVIGRLLSQCAMLG